MNGVTNDKRHSVDEREKSKTYDQEILHALRMCYKGTSFSLAHLLDERADGLLAVTRLSTLDEVLALDVVATLGAKC